MGVGVAIGLFALALLQWAGVAVAAPPPANDDFDAGLPVQIGEDVSGTTLGATSEPGEPTHAGVGAGASVWYRLSTDRSGVIRIECSAGFEAVLAVYAGSTLSSLREVGADSSGTECGDPELEFRVDAGGQYELAVDVLAGHAGGSFELRLEALTPPPANDDFSAAEPVQGGGLVSELRGSTAGAGREPGEPQHGGGPAGSSVWFTWVAGRSGTARIYPCDGSYHPAIDVYTGASLATLSQVSRPADVGGEIPWCGLGGRGGATIEVTAGTTYSIAVDGSDGEWGFFRIELLEAALPDTNPPTTELSGEYFHRRFARFEFEARDFVAPLFPGLELPEPGEVHYLCSLDRRPPVACASPKRYGGLSNGRHLFEVAAVDAAGNVDPSPARRRFRVHLKRRRRR
jgi:hypothetical protein